MESVKTHRALLGGKHIICAIEDVDLESVRGEIPKKIFAMPILIEGIDSMQVTVFAEICRTNY